MGEKTALDLDEIILDFSNWQEVSRNGLGPVFVCIAVCVIHLYIVYIDKL